MNTPIDRLARVTAKRYESALAVATAEVGAAAAEDKALHDVVFFQVADAMQIVSYARALERTLAQAGASVTLSDYQPVNAAVLS